MIVAGVAPIMAALPHCELDCGQPHAAMSAHPSCFPTMLPAGTPTQLGAPCALCLPCRAGLVPLLLQLFRLSLPDAVLDSAAMVAGAVLKAHVKPVSLSLLHPNAATGLLGLDDKIIWMLSEATCASFSLLGYCITPKNIYNWSGNWSAALRLPRLKLSTYVARFGALRGSLLLEGVSSISYGSHGLYGMKAGLIVVCFLATHSANLQLTQAANAVLLQRATYALSRMAGPPSRACVGPPSQCTRWQRR